MDAVISARDPQNRSDHNRFPDKQATLGSDELRRMNAYWRAANYLSVGQIYLYDNPLLKEPLKLSHVKPLVVGHWGTTPGQNFIYVHLNRVIKKHDLDMFYIAGPGHGGPAIVANVYLEGTWSEIYPNISQDEFWSQEAVQAVFLSRRDFQSRRADDARIYPRRWRARLFAQSCLRGRIRQSPTNRRLRHWRRRSGNRSSGDGVAVQQAAQSGQRRSRAPDPPSQRLQDKQPDRSRSHRARGIGSVSARLRLDAIFCRRRRAGKDASTDGRYLGAGHRGH